MDWESFRFVRTEEDEYPDDIVNDASDKRRMGLVPNGTTPLGYVAEGTPLYDEAGNVLWENLLENPPADGTPYVTFYGERFLVHEEYFTRVMPLAVDVFKLLLECVQKIRYNGPSVGSLLEVTKVLGEGYVYDLSIVPTARYYACSYRLDADKEAYNRERRYGAWQNICKQKFKLFEFELVEE
jgi:hypothetical protein